ncbi:succinylglutamate desuccinylase/aspartoacylase family protein [Neolewinella persica]|uniref:succinylglutamate desuccinylase/aspartoacylase family protein n=1 Tax=Neolewinella persica TaxID=70998 RepID=UPI0003684048|nr:succinylglutamate desuccinylase/aspartoacylase family protein [Neolewinella persica]
MSSETYKDKISILGVEIQRGESKVLDFDVAKLHTRNSIKVPIFIERAKKDGPVVLLLGGVHGDEINGVEIVRRIIRNKINKPTRGTIISIPVFNIFGFLNLSRKFPDGRDLNRVFPGSAKGSLASQFAFQFKKDIAPHVDYVLDFHSGGGHRVNVAQTRCMLDDEKTLELAKVFNAPFIVQSKTISKSLRETFKELGKTALLFEGGKSMLYDEKAIQYGVQGARNVLRFLKMKSFKALPRDPSIIIAKSKWLRASHSGMFHVHIENGTWVTKKTVMGVITDPFGSFERKVYAPFDCYVFCVNIAPIVNRGDAVFHVSLELK